MASKESEKLSDAMNNALLAICNEEIQEYKKQIEKNRDKALQELMNEMCQVMDDIIHRVIANWYELYVPTLYIRRDYLYKAITIEKSNGEINFTLSVNNSDYDDANSVQEYVFRQGYHGGIIGDKKEGYPDYKKKESEQRPWYSFVKSNGWRVWLRPAEQSFSIIQRIQDEIQSYDMTDIITKIIKKYF